VYAATDKVERVVVRRMRRWRAMLPAREAAGALGRERRAGTVMRGVVIRVPWITSVRRKWIQGGNCTVKRPREIVPMIFKVWMVRITAISLPSRFTGLDSESASYYFTALRIPAFDIFVHIFSFTLYWALLP